MTRLQLTGLALAVACVIATPLAAGAQMIASAPPPQVDYYTGTPVYTPGDEAGMIAATRNNLESRQYEALLSSSPAFRQRRMRQECGSITEPGLHQGCIDSFGDRTAAAHRYGKRPSNYDASDQR